MLFLGLGGILAFSSTYPVGYADVQVHIAATLETVVDGRLDFRPESSINFVALYVVTTALADLTGTSVPAAARLFPVAAFVVSVLVFYHGIARRFLDARAALFAAFVFGTNWGVFRFGVEFRTLNVALLFLLVVISLLIREWFTTHLAKENMVVYTLLIAALATSHLTTYAFYLAMLTVVVVAFALQQPRRNLLNYLLVSVAALFGYMTYVGGSLRATTVVVGAEALSIVARFTGTAPAASYGTSTQGLIGLTYGYNMFLAQWTLRGLFVLSFGLFVFGWVRRRERFGTLVILASGVLGFGVLATSFVATFVNPSRVLTFFALPYALTYAGGLCYAFHERRCEEDVTTTTTPRRFEAVHRLLDRTDRLLSGPTARTVVRVIVVAVVLIAVTSTLMKFPAFIVGETEPIRTHQPIDDLPYLQFDGYETSARTFVLSHHAGPVQYAYGDWTRATAPFYSSVIEQPDEDIADELDRLTLVGVEYHAWADSEVELAPDADRVYDNGEVVLHHETAVVNRP
ncbi:hypothetical protein C2R22_15430 [Salinigranum rubrum]|uniref:Glycosyltransferase RgtA/B/C/D-like domain-containing protein n=1 Tax=Salinigranum rubrum TaxID=755307 RepID=A0A2I8VLR7_9EURY|nr:hypothetical protein [Salinigranum rubrum]AUV82858.1 hypothetical protein C2R22_15430 [Salinigranum rubrum]